MVEEIQMTIDETTEAFEKAIEHYRDELVKVRAGRANPSMLNSVMVEAYGAQMPLNQVATVTTPDARTLMIKPFDKSTLPNIERGIMAANVGLTPQNDGETIRINIPPLTEERRKELVKQIKAIAEECKISIRNARRDGMNMIKSLEKDGVSEDEIKRGEDALQTVVNDHVSKVEEILEVKEKEIMTV